MRNEGRGETLFCMTILYLNNLARQSRFSDICQHLGLKGFVHYVVCWPNSLKVKLNSERA